MAGATTALATARTAAWSAIHRISCAVFGTVYNPTNQRNGLKELRKNLVGPAVVNYYPVTANAWGRWDPEYVDEDIEYAQGKAARLRRRGKGPPKKGTSCALLGPPDAAAAGLTACGVRAPAPVCFDRRGQACDAQGQEEVAGTALASSLHVYDTHCVQTAARLRWSRPTAPSVELGGPF